MNKNKGFTLIELLVVIAIIGILSSVVLASLSSARNKGKDAAVKAQLASMKAQAELYYSKADSYAGFCTDTQANNGLGGTAGPGLLKATQDSAGVATTIKVLPTDAGSAVAPFTITCHDAVDTWAVDAPLVGDANPMYCTDSTGVSRTEAAAMVASATACI